MGETVTFIHTADLHLGAPFLGLRTSSGKWAQRMVEAIPQAFGRAIDAAIDRRVDFVVIAGDIFDLEHPSFADYACFIDGMERLQEAGIPVYCCTGNHDPYVSWQHRYGKLPENVFMFPAGAQVGYFVYERDGQPLVLLGGRGYYNHSWPAGEDIAAGISREAGERALRVHPPFAVGVLHTGLDIDPVKAPTDPGALLKKGMDYWALGHVHTPRVYGKDNPRIAFSGCIQGRKIRDAGMRGVQLVTLSEGKPNHLELIPTASVVWEQVRVDISSSETLADAIHLAEAELFRLNGEAFCDEMIERITFVGTTPLHGVLRQPGVIEDLRRKINDDCSAFYCDALIDETAAPFDRGKALAEGLFPSVFLRTCAQNAADRAGEVAYLQQEFIERGVGISNASARVMDSIDRRAQELVLDMLDRGGDGE